MGRSRRAWVQHLLLVYVCVVVLLSQCECLSERKLSEFEEVVKKALHCRNVPAASVTLVQDGKVLMKRSFGKADPEKNIHAKDDTKFCIGSLTKAFTSTILAKLVTERKNVTFDTPIRDIIGDSFKLSDDVRTNLVSLRDLLSHRVGVPAYFKALVVGFPETVDRSEVVRRIRYMPATEPIRTKFMYSNYMYTLAGYVAERMTGKSWESLVEDYILTPLGMRNSGFIDRLFNFTNLALPVATKHGKLTNLDPMLLHAVHPCGPAGSLYSTAADMAKWVQLLLNNGKSDQGDQVFDPRVIAETQEPGMAAPVLQDNLKRPTFPVGDVQMYYDMAWVTSLYRGFKLVWHSGGIITHSSRLWLFPDKNVGIYAVVNGPQSHTKSLALRAIMSYAADILLGEDPWLNTSTICSYPAPWKEGFESASPPTVTDTTTVTARPAQDYVGSYYHRGFGEIRVELKEDAADTLRMTFGRFGKMNLYPQSETMFHGRYYGPLWFMSDSDDQFQPEIVEFVKNKDNRISGLIYSIDTQYNSTMFSKGSYYPLETLSTWTFACPHTSSASVHSFSRGLLIITILSSLYCHLRQCV
ncbi:putative beta-lactamase-like 1 [Haliotis rufescens]|uniref:putative beta-lactamase-like 1 n=1 Tax=Haliotis rufescens TaxID=6454 RepID=UPI00201F0AB4|nr:putative beta-lactamase-like 1 [Haliotis rufescens]